jgi:(hydroxyamino)benzene mutase
MEIRNPERLLVRAGFLLFTLALITGLAIPAFFNPRMALAAHVTGTLNGLVLIALGLAWRHFAFGPRQAGLTRGAFLYGTYGNWATSCLAAAWGTQRLTPIAGAGFGAAAWQEITVQVLQVSLGIAMLAGSLSVIHALRPQPAGA